MTLKKNRKNVLPHFEVFSHIFSGNNKEPLKAAKKIHTLSGHFLWIHTQVGGNLLNFL